MSIGFFLIAGVMLLSALALILRPMLRSQGSDAIHRRRLDALDRALAEGVVDAEEFARKRQALLTDGGATVTHRAPLLPAMLLAALIPAGAVAVYVSIGTPQALDPANLVATSPPSDDPHAAGGGTPQLADAISGLEKRLAVDPDNLDGWMLLGRAYKATERFAESASALKNAHDLAPDNADVMVEYAEAMALANAQRRFIEPAQDLLRKALAGDPQHQRALWLMGIAQAQAENYAAAVSHWEKLLPMLEPDSEVAKQVQNQLEEARTRAGLVPPAAAEPRAVASAGKPATGATAGPRLTIEIDIAPELAARLSATDVLYVFARAADGPRMPLAMQRLPGAKFPLTVSLDDSMGMMPSLKLSDAVEVVVGARVSKSGVANPQSGDLEVFSPPLAPATRTTPVKLLINQVVP